jgi:hypothetical protein
MPEIKAKNLQRRMQAKKHQIMLAVDNLALLYLLLFHCLATALTQKAHIVT